jgi:hypothetical protein
MTHAQKPDFVFLRNGRVHLNRRGRQFSRLLSAEVCASAVVMVDTSCSKVVRRVLATHSIRQFPLHSPSRASPCAITFQLDSTTAVAMCTGTSVVMNRGGSDMKVSTKLPLWLPCVYVKKDAAQAKSRRRRIPDGILSVKCLQYN